jgi:hypothetical protein
MLEHGLNPQVAKNTDVLGQPAAMEISQQKTMMFKVVSAVAMISDFRLKKIWSRKF